MCPDSAVPERDTIELREEIIRACVFLMENYNEENFINVGTQSEISIKDLALLISDIVGYKGEIVWDATKPDGTPRKLMDSSRLFALGWKPRIELPEGIASAYNDFLSTKGNFVRRS